MSTTIDHVPVDEAVSLEESLDETEDGTMDPELARLEKLNSEAHDLSSPSSAVITPCMAYQPGVVMIVGHVSGEISLWDFLHLGDKTDKPRSKSGVLLEVRAVLKHGTSPVVAITLSRDKRMFVSGDAKGDVKRWASAELLQKRFKNLALPPGGITSLPGTLLANAISSRSMLASTGTSTGSLLKASSSGEKASAGITTTTQPPEPNF